MPVPWCWRSEDGERVLSSAQGLLTRMSLLTQDSLPESSGALAAGPSQRAGVVLSAPTFSFAREPRTRGSRAFDSKLPGSEPSRRDTGPSSANLVSPKSSLQVAKYKTCRQGFSVKVILPQEDVWHYMGHP